MAKYIKFIALKTNVIFVTLLLITGLTANDCWAQTQHYKRVFPGSVSPKPDSIKVRDAREQMKTDVQKQRQQLKDKQRGLMPDREKPPLVGSEPSEIYYKVSVNDRLFISVWRVRDLSLEFIVRPDGKISFPLIGDIDAAGRTLSEVDAEITEKLKEYVEDPQVSVMIREFAGDKVTIIGEVKSPGIYKFVGKTNIIDVVALANGFTDRARSASLVIVREPEGPLEDESLIVVDIKSILKGSIKDNIEVHPNDIIYVSRTTISHVKEFYDNWIVPTVDRIIDYETYKTLRRSRHR